MNSVEALKAMAHLPLDFAKEMARNEASEILLISGPIPMTIGYPCEEHQNVIQLATLMTQDMRKVGLYRILQKRELYRVMEDMENHGGYRCALYGPDGSIDAGYYL